MLDNLPSQTTGQPVPTVRFTLNDAQRAADEWGCNCGPGAVAGILGISLDDAKPHLGDFATKRYTNPTLMWSILRSLGVKFSYRGGHLGTENWPSYGLARIQWEGPWTKEGVPRAAAYRHTHWVGARRAPGRTDIFDVNAMCVGGWVPLAEWGGSLVPWLLAEVAPRANGAWHITHAVEVAL